MNGIDTYAYNADLYCEDCGLSIKRVIDHFVGNNLDNNNVGVNKMEDSNYYPQYVGDSGGGESDSPQHCGNCSMFLENSLTSDGENYLKEMIAEGSTNGIQDLIHAEWKQYYNYLFV
tara:strand:- start:243 stop:593 length:351 start_codon:yes stop_codon:yes gene_type:complete